MFQDMENKIRSTLNEIYFGKTKDIVNGLRYSYMSCLDNLNHHLSFYSTVVISICSSSVFLVVPFLLCAESLYLCVSIC